MVAHSQLTGAELHEPKGVASATVGKFYVANGAGSGTWKVADYTTLGTGMVVQTVNTQTGSLVTTTTQIPYDDSIPQNTEGGEMMTLAITPLATTHKLKIDVIVNASHGGAGEITVALFQDSTAGAIAAVAQEVYLGDQATYNIKLTHYMTAGTTSSTTFKVRAGANASGTLAMNGNGSNRRLGGVMASSITITEIKA